MDFCNFLFREGILIDVGANVDEAGVAANVDGAGVAANVDGADPHETSRGGEGGRPSMKNRQDSSRLKDR